MASDLQRVAVVVANVTTGAVLAAVVALTASGCGGDMPEAPARASISGEVTINGEPVKKGVALFIPPTGPSVPVPVVDGRYEADETSGPYVGTNRVEVISTDDGGLGVDDEEGWEEAIAAPRGQAPKIVPQEIPKEFNANSELTANVSAEVANEIDFHMVSTSAKRRR